MAIKKKYPKVEPKQHGSGSIYIDAAIEALRQEREKNSNFSYLILHHDNEKQGLELQGDVSNLATCLAHWAQSHREILKLINIASFARKMELCKERRDDILEVLNNSERLIEEWIEELRRNKDK